jgi:hypothetical protein
MFYFTSIVYIWYYFFAVYIAIYQILFTLLSNFIMDANYNRLGFLFCYTCKIYISGKNIFINTSNRMPFSLLDWQYL